MEELWIQEELRKLDRKKAIIKPTKHLLCDKNPSSIELEFIEQVIRDGKIHYPDCTYEERRICFKNYFKHVGKTYFVIVKMHEDFMAAITVYSEHGKY